MKVLITGGAGFIGSHIAEYFSGKAEIVILDNLSTGSVNNLTGVDCRFIQGDVRNNDIVKEAVRGADIVFHLAAMVSVPESMKFPVVCADINVNGMLNVLTESVKAGVETFIFSSSCSVYGNNPVIPKVETMMPEPESPYAVTKIDGEYYSNIFSGNSSVRTVCLRYFNVFGPRQKPDSDYAAVIPSFIVNALNGRDLIIYGDGCQTRDFIYVKDVVRANVFAAENKINGIFNVACGNKISVTELAEKILSLTGGGGGIIYQSERPGDVKHSVASVSKISAAGFDLSYNFDEGIKETISYYKKQNKWE
jgi:UDP-glucose 4-epimerase